MHITYLGHSSFLLVSDGGTSIVTDPYGDIGLKFPSVHADAVTVSHSHFDHANVSAVQGSVQVFDSEGDFSIGDVKIRSVKRFHDDVRGKKRGETLVFSFEMGGIRICHLGDIGEPYCDALKALIPPPDVLLIPVGGNYTIDARQAKEYVDALAPRIVIPMHFFVPNLKVDVAPPEPFLELYEKTESREGTLELKREALPSKTQIIFMKRSK